MKRNWLILLSVLLCFIGIAAPDAAFARGGGGCFEQGTPVRTPQGDVAIEQLQIGDEMQGGGKVAAVYQVQPAEYLELPNGVHVTPEHPFQVAPGTFRTAELVFPNAPRVTAEKPAFNLMVSPGGTYTAGGYLVHNKGCFLPDTPILRADRSSAAISQIRVGDRLLAFDAEGKVVETTVRSVITREADEYLNVRTDKAELRVTREHPFYVGEGTFKTIEALRVGDTVFAFDGNGLTAQTINAIAPVPGKITVYNLQTDAPNTYFAAGIAVHNKGGGGCFEQGTPVRTPQGDVAIEQLQIGDEVQGGGKVAAVYQVQPAEYLELPNGVHVTPEHPFQVARGTFRTAELVFPNAPRVPAEKPAFNLMVSPGGTYTAGGYLVHNKGCFLPDTPILRADRSSAAISQVQVGEQLLAFDAEGKVVETTVRSVITREADEYLNVRTDKTELRVTREHPFYVGEGTFKTLEALRVGDTVFAFDGNGLTAQTINAIAPVPGKITVYNLQTDAPNTYFAAGIAVHNKGGSSSGFRSSSSSSSSSRSHYYGSGRSSNDDDDDECCTFFIILLIILLVVLICWAIKQQKNGIQDTLDFLYSRNAIDGKAKKTLSLLNLLVQRGEDMFAPNYLRQITRETFCLLQQCWQARDYAEMRSLLMPDLYEDHCKQLNGLRRNHEINVVEGLEIEQIDLVHVRCPVAEQQREFTALITASAVDYYLDDRTRTFLRGDRTRARFQEFWTFQRQDGKWLLREIEQTRESDVLKEANYVEQLDTKEISQAVSAEADQQTELKASRIEQLLRTLAKRDSSWDINAMRTRSRQAFIAVIAAKESGYVELLPEEEMFPAAAEAFRQYLANMQQSGLSAEYRNLCVRKVQIVHVRNCADNSQDEFTARINAHAQLIVRRGNEVVKKDEDVRAFVEYWTFGRHGSRWKLKEVQQEVAGRRRAGADSVAAPLMGTEYAIVSEKYTPLQQSV